ncbi:MAG: beta-lactamase family protein [Phycisphaerales bacterium]|nr:beta-lactamase family protein [Phycisphaerales bacterium]
MTPESVGVPSSAILSVLQRFESLLLPMHSFLVFRHGKLISENYWKPFHRDLKHRMYSVSKSFVSLAVGVMADEGRIALDDPVAKYFPEHLPVNPHEYITRATIRDMLRMTDCHDAPTYSFTDNNWVKTWFDTPPTHPAGTIFSYNTVCTNLCCAIVEKVAGIPFIDYLYPRVLTPIGVSDGIVCIQSPEGYSFGGSGVLCTPLDLARVALLCMNGGRWDGRQLISESYIREATARQVDTTLTTDNINEQQGYGYQFWRTRSNGFACYGMGSQYAICLPDYDLVVITTADTQGNATAGYAIHETIYNGLLPALCNEALPENPDAYQALEQYSASLQLPIVQGMPSSPTITSGITYRFTQNPLHISAVRFDFHKNEIVMTYEKPNGIHKLTFGVGKLVEQSFPETHYSGMRIGVPLGRGYQAQASAAWADETTLLAKASITDDYFGSFSMNATFIGDELTLLMTKIAEDFLDDYQGFAAGRRAS